MKKKLSFALLILFSAVLMVACEQKDKGFLPQKSTQEYFKTMYPHAKRIEWEMEKGYYVAEFRDGGYEKEAWYSTDGDWLLTETDYERNTPAIIKETIAKTNYADWRIDDVDFVEFKDKVPFYVVEVEKGESEMDLFFSENGEFLREANSDGDYRPTPMSVL